MDAEYLAFCSVGSWSTLFIDAVTDPGNVKITLSAWFDLVPIRASAVVLMDQA